MSDPLAPLTSLTSPMLRAPTVFWMNNVDCYIDNTLNGQIGLMGNSSLSDEPGGWSVQFVPTVDFVGAFGIVGRQRGKVADTRGAPYLPFPYRRVNVGGAASDYALVTDVITGTAAIEIPAHAWAIGILIACTAGSCRIFKQHMVGATAP